MTQHRHTLPRSFNPPFGSVCCSEQVQSSLVLDTQQHHILLLTFAAIFNSVGVAFLVSIFYFSPTFSFSFFPFPISSLPCSPDTRSASSTLSAPWLSSLSLSISPSPYSFPKFCFLRRLLSRVVVSLLLHRSARNLDPFAQVSVYLATPLAPIKPSLATFHYNGSSDDSLLSLTPLPLSLLFVYHIK